MWRRSVLGLGLAFIAAASGARALSTGTAAGTAAEFGFGSIDGGRIELGDYAGRPVLVVNTASRCGFVDQFGGLQALYDRFRGRGLTVIGVPSDSFRQELRTEAEVKEFCEVNFEIDFPIAEITPVVGPGAHPFYAWAARQGAGPRWNFHKILLDGQGRIAGAFGPTVAPDAPRLLAAIEAVLPQA